MYTYTEAIDYLYSRLPMFTRDGVSAFKKDLDRTIALCEALDNPQNRYKTIHVGGTNGKGSSSHMLASILAVAGYRTGLYTSPHLVDFRERIRVNGQQIDAQFVVDYVNSQRKLMDEVQPSFFEATVAMAFDYFASQRVDVAIIEVGLGGRLDSTNIIKPELCLITNIGMDHMNLLGDTLEAIAEEKAGIIKSGTPVVISETNPKIAPIFLAKARQENSHIVFADQLFKAKRLAKSTNTQRVEVTSGEGMRVLDLDLTGSYQLKNIVGLLAVVQELRKLGFTITDQHLSDALRRVQQTTGLQGRWQTVSTDPLIICDTGHNEDGIKEVVKNLNEIHFKQLHIVIGAMRDKDLDHMLPYLPKDAVYYFSNPDMPRAMDASELAAKALAYDLQGQIYGSVSNALRAAKKAYKQGDLIFVGGSNFVVAEVLGGLEG